jgi:hypothetical protein
MPIPAFTIDGVLPPYVGPAGPGGSPQDMSPYEVSALEVIVTLGTSEKRKSILRGWLNHRSQLRLLGFDRGFQWLDGSFVENKDPNDLDVVCFLYRPFGINGPSELSALMRSQPALFNRNAVKSVFKLDLFPIDLNGSPDGLVNLTRYFLGLFSHRRIDDLWKGMLQVRLENAADDATALAVLGPAPTNAATAQGGTP